MKILTAILTIFFILLSTPAFAKTFPDNQEIKTLITSLNKHIINLEKRVSTLEAKHKNISASIPAGKSEWRKLRKGMSREAVREILGEPETIDGGDFEIWYYAKPRYHSRVKFYMNRVDSWDEPR